MLRQFGSLVSALRHAPRGRDTRFEDLWPFHPDAPLRIAQKVATSAMSLEDAGRIAEFSAHGYVVLPSAIEEPLIDALVRDLRSIGRYPGHFVTTDHRNGKPQRLSGEDFDAYESVFDTYVNFESARRVSMHPTIRRLVRHLFDMPVVATQQLLFQRSNQHPLHQDTSVVCAEDPLLMVATWVALEDVVPGRGELTYYEGSHRIPHRLYADGTKRLNPEADDAEAARRYLVEQCERLGCAKRDFIARKGDVFLWSADLVHGSNPRTRPEEETRLSLVTHYSPRRTNPFWFRQLPKHRGRALYGDLTYVSQYYELPGNGGMQKPVRF